MSDYYDHFCSIFNELVGEIPSSTKLQLDSANGVGYIGFKEALNHFDYLNEENVKFINIDDK